MLSLTGLIQCSYVVVLGSLSYCAPVSTPSAAPTPSPAPVATVVPTKAPTPVAVLPTAAPTIVAVVPPPVPRGSYAPVRMADSIVDGVGFDTHFNYWNTEYNYDPRVARALIASGVRHIRDASSAMTIALEKVGIGHGYGFNQTTTAAQMLAAVAKDPGIEYIEGANEPDYPKTNPSWVALTTAQTKLIWATFAGKYTVLATPFSHTTSYAAMSDLSAFFNYGNEHDGTCAYEPETTTANAIGPKLALMKVMTGGAPIITSETGYNDTTQGGAYGSNGATANPNGCYVDDFTQAKYIPRTLAERLRLGEKRTYFYQFSVMERDKVFGQTGMYAFGAPKPQLTALESMLALLQDRGSDFTPVDQHVTVTGAVHSIVAAKRDGSTWVLVWQPAHSWDQSKFVRLAVPTVPVTITSTSSVAQASVWNYNTTTWGLTKSVVPMSGGKLILPVGDTLTFVAFNAAGAGYPAAPVATPPPSVILPTPTPTTPPSPVAIVTAAPTAKPTPAPTAAPVVKTDLGCPHFGTSVICKPLPASPKVASNSAAWAAVEFGSATNQISNFSSPLGDFPLTTTGETGPLTVVCNKVSWSSTGCDAFNGTVQQVPLAQVVSANTDHHTAWNTLTGEMDGWLADVRPSSGTWAFGTLGFCAWSGNGSNCGHSNATNMAASLGLVFPAALSAAEKDPVHGTLGFAVAVAVLCADPSYVAPAAASDGTNTNSYPICSGHTGTGARPPEGTRAFLADTDAQVDAMGFPPYLAALWRTVDEQHYGFVISDTAWAYASGGFSVQMIRGDYSAFATESGAGGTFAWKNGPISPARDIRFCSSGTC